MRINRYRHFSYLLAIFWLWAGNAHAGPTIQHWQTSKGMQVYYLPANDLPMLDMRLVFRAGSAWDGAKLGCANITSRLLDEGTGDWTATQLAEQFEDVGAIFSTGSLRDMAWLSLRSLTEKKALAQAINAFSLAATQPSFATDAFQRERNRMKTALIQQRESPSSIALDAFYAAVYKGHPYATPVKGTLESLDSLRLQQVKAFYQQYYVAANAILAIVGAVDRPAAERLAEQVSKGLNKGQAAKALPAVAPLLAAKKIVIQHPSAQTHVWLGQAGVQRGDPDYYALYVGNYILGGSSLVSRLGEDIREQRGLAYSVSSAFEPMLAKGPFKMVLQTKNSQAAEAETRMTEVLARYLEEGPSEQELLAAKRYITGSYPLGLDSNRKLLGYLVMIGYYHLGLDYIDTFPLRVNALTAAQVQKSLQARLQVEQMVTIQVGGQQP